MGFSNKKNRDTEAEEKELKDFFADAEDAADDYDADQVDADILDSLFSEEETELLAQEEALKEEVASIEESDAFGEQLSFMEPSSFEEPASGEEPSAAKETASFETVASMQESQTFEEPVTKEPEVPEVPVMEDALHATAARREREDGITVITRGTTINGSIISDCSLDVMGTINGDIECLGKLSITGKVIGNSMASEVFVDTDRLEGSINSEGCVKIAQQTVVIGDITAASGVFAGAVKGEIDISGPVVIDSTAVIQGDIKAKSIQMNNGAVLDGRVSLSYASGLDISSVFDVK